MDVLRLICWYAPQSGRSFEEKQCCYDKLKCEWYMHSADVLAMCLGDFNGHICRHIDGFGGLHGGYGVGERKLEGRMLLVLTGEGIMCVKYMVNVRGKEEGDKTTAYSKCEGNPWGVSAFLSDSRYR